MPIDPNLFSAIAAVVGVALTAAASIGGLRRRARLRDRMRENLELLGALPAGAHPNLRAGLQAETDFCAEQLTELSRRWLVRARAAPERRRTNLVVAAVFLASAALSSVAPTLPLFIALAGGGITALALVKRVRGGYRRDAASGDRPSAAESTAGLDRT
jgi:hypothetical protein